MTFIIQKAAFILFPFFYLVNADLHANCELLNWLHELKEPVCSQDMGKTRLLPETAPAVAHVISDIRSKVTPDTTYVVDTAIAICEDALETNRQPYIIFPNANDELKQKLFTAIEENVKLNKNLQSLKKCKDSLLFPHITSKIIGHLWPQDYFIPRFDQETGQITVIAIKEAQNYVKELFAPLVDHCKTKAGLPLVKFSETPLGEGRYTQINGGGNALGLPQGIYLTSEVQNFDEIGHRLGGNRDHLLQTPLNFLHLGHVDEVISVSKETYGGKKERCQIVFSIVSPKAAFEILATSSSAFTDLRLYLKQPGLNMLSQEIYRHEFETDRTAINERNKKLEAEIRQLKYKNDGLNFELLYGKATEQERDSLRSQIKAIIHEIEILETFDLTKYSGKDVLSIVFKDGSSARKENDSIQIAMDKLKLKILQKYQDTCDVSFIDLPALYFQSHTVFPSAVNAVQGSNTIIYSDQHNADLNQYIKSQFESIGVRPVIVEGTAIHEGGGGLHCATNALRVCAQ